MPNPLFGFFNNTNQFSNLINQFNSFKNTFSGNPRQQVQNLINSGQISQQQFAQLQQMADQFKKMFNV